MIKKVINSNDIHVNGQQLRIVHKKELAGSVEGFNNIDLLLNEPRGSKYVNLFIYDVADTVINIEAYSNSVLDNRETLQKGFIASLLERGSIDVQKDYTIREEARTYTYTHERLGAGDILEVDSVDDVYAAGGRKVRVETVDFELSVENIAEIKEYIATYEAFTGYLLLLNEEGHVTVNEEKVILAYPVSEAVSVLNEVYGKEEITTLNRSRVEIIDGEYKFEHCLISNSQFYIDDSDIYSKGFVIR